MMTQGDQSQLLLRLHLGDRQVLDPVKPRSDKVLRPCRRESLCLRQRLLLLLLGQNQPHRLKNRVTSQSPKLHLLWQRSQPISPQPHLYLQRVA
jgi:hypothetical protein